MTSPLKNVPLNTKRIFVRATIPGGCHLYLPASTTDAKELSKLKVALQRDLYRREALARLDKL